MKAKDKYHGHNSFFVPLEISTQDLQLQLQKFSLKRAVQPHPWCRLAAFELQQYLRQQKEWSHNFGLEAEGEGTVIGKMFGVLVVKTNEKQIGYLAAFSGKMAGTNLHTKFVPPVYDALADDGFLNAGMQELTRMNKDLDSLTGSADMAMINSLKRKRKAHSAALQQKLFDHYHFINSRGESRSLRELFANTRSGKPPAGAGECAGPKLLQYAYQHKLKPIALAEFWWGLSPKSAQWKHGNFYSPCLEKCHPILTFMLS